MKPDVLVMFPLRPAQMEMLAERYVLHRHDLADDAGRQAMIARLAPVCEAIVTNGHTALTAAEIAALPRLKVVACSSAGYEYIDTRALAAHGATLTNTSDALLDDVADLAILLLLAARRNLVAADAYVRSGDWGRKGMFPLQSAVHGKRLGIVGMGTIGRAIVARAEPLGLEIAYFSRTAKSGIDHPFQPDLEELARWADILVVIVAGGDGTRNLIDGRILRALGPTGTLVNVSRGTVVDESALISALKNGSLGSAGLDVYWNEPNPDPALTALPNVTLYPHHASGTEETRAAMAQLVVDNLDAYFAGRPLLTPVN